MTETIARVPAATATRARTAITWLPLGVALLAALGFVVFLVWPYYANGLHHLPLDEVAGGGHDPKDLWPMREVSGTAVAFRIGGMLTVLFGPWVALGAGLFGAYAAVRHRQDRTRWVPGALAGVVMIGVLAWLMSPIGSALVSWWLD